MTRGFAFFFGAVALGGLLSVPGLGWGESGSLEALVFAVDIDSSSAGSSDVGQSIAQTITNDLRGSGRFTPIHPSAIVARGTATARSRAVPQFGIWREAGAQVLVTGRTIWRDGKLKSEFFIWDVVTGQAIQGQVYVSGAEEWLQISHAISGVIYERFVGEKRDFGLGQN
jgi:TolB protein